MLELKFKPILDFVDTVRKSNIVEADRREAVITTAIAMALAYTVPLEAAGSVNPMQYFTEAHKAFVNPICEVGEMRPLNYQGIVSAATGIYTNRYAIAHCISSPMTTAHFASWLAGNEGTYPALEMVTNNANVSLFTAGNTGYVLNSASGLMAEIEEPSGE
ncbi:hypothetical protein [Proteus phage 10]|uniref:hypothetical protein n=1 Tax=Proteus TaxID=583 RepID=UPI0015F1CD2D|nr:hypothetical protein [Proteus columbae]QMP24190.1 hypothetical protein [Proteus phage 10]